MLDNGKAAYQYNISVPKQLSFAICRKGVLCQQQTHHLHFVQNTPNLVAAL